MGKSPKSALKNTKTPQSQIRRTLKAKGETPKGQKGQTPKGQKSHTPKGKLEIVQSPNRQIKNLKTLKGQSQTPIPSRPNGQSPKIFKGRTPKSEPPAKRKKLSQELDDELSDNEFDKITNKLKYDDDQSGDSIDDSVLESDSNDDVEKASDDDSDISSADDEETSAGKDQSGSSNDEDSNCGSDDEEEEISSDNDDEEEISSDNDDEVEISSDNDDEDNNMDEDKISSDDVPKKLVKEKKVLKCKAKVQKNSVKLSKQNKKADYDSSESSDSSSSDAENEVEPEVDAKVQKMVTSLERKDLDKLKQRDDRVLFIKGFSTSVTEQDIMDLSSDIIDVRLFKKGKSKKKAYAYLEFKTEKIAEKNHKVLTTKTLEDSKFTVDFMGEKSVVKQQRKADLPPYDVDAKTLFVKDFGEKTEHSELEKLFPKAYKIDIPKCVKRAKKKSGRKNLFCFVHFKNVVDCKEARESSQNLTLNGDKKLTVMYAKKDRVVEPKKRKATDTDGDMTAKKEKVDSNTDGNNSDDNKNDSDGHDKIDSDDDSEGSDRNDDNSDEDGNENTDSDDGNINTDSGDDSEDGDNKDSDDDDDDEMDY